MKEEELKKLKEEMGTLGGMAACHFHDWREEFKKAEKMAQDFFHPSSATSTPIPTGGEVCETINFARLKEEEFKEDYSKWIEKLAQYESKKYETEMEKKNRAEK